MLITCPLRKKKKKIIPVFFSLISGFSTCSRQWSFYRTSLIIRNSLDFKHLSIVLQLLEYTLISIVQLWLPLVPSVSVNRSIQLHIHRPHNVIYIFVNDVHLWYWLLLYGQWSRTGSHKCVNGNVYVWGIPHPIIQAETLTIFFPFKYVTESYKNDTPIFRIFWKVLWQCGSKLSIWHWGPNLHYKFFD